MVFPMAGIYLTTVSVRMQSSFLIQGSRFSALQEPSKKSLATSSGEALPDVSSLFPPAGFLTFRKKVDKLWQQESRNRLSLKLFQRTD
jgi:hypothetical protein